jgi:hypothetical protein
LKDEFDEAAALSPPTHSYDVLPIRVAIPFPSHCAPQSIDPASLLCGTRSHSMLSSAGI